jgi:serine/threonine protein kinase
MSLSVFLFTLKVLWREIGIWKRMRHECIVPLLGTTTDFSADHSVSFVSSWMPNGTLNTYLKTKKDNISLGEKYDLVS